MFDRARSASVLAATPDKGSSELECWTVSAEEFRNHVLRSKNMVSTFNKYASKTGDDGGPLMTMVRVCNYYFIVILENSMRIFCVQLHIFKL